MRGIVRRSSRRLVLVFSMLLLAAAQGQQPVQPMPGLDVLDMFGIGDMQDVRDFPEMRWEPGAPYVQPPFERGESPFERRFFMGVRPSVPIPVAAVRPGGWYRSYIDREQLLPEHPIRRFLREYFQDDADADADEEKKCVVLDGNPGDPLSLQYDVYGVKGVTTRNRWEYIQFAFFHVRGPSDEAPIVLSVVASASAGQAGGNPSTIKDDYPRDISGDPLEDLLDRTMTALVEFLAREPFHASETEGDACALAGASGGA